MPSGLRDVIVVGGGPAGLAAAIGAAARGLDVLVLERAELPADKACGEGLLPSGVRALDALGVLAHLAGEDFAVIEAIRWVDGGVTAEARLPEPRGRGIRRTALSRALLARARAAGVEVRTRSPVLRYARGVTGVDLTTAAGHERARLLVAADGLASSIRRTEHLDAPAEGPPRFGLRRHFAAAPWSGAVEVHFGDGAEAYVTPVGRRSVNVAVLCEAWARVPYPSLLRRFPELQARLSGAATESSTAGAGPFPRGCLARACDRLVLVGDAAGFVDGITGDGLSLAFESAMTLAMCLPGVLAAGATRHALSPWEEGERRRFQRYAAATRAVLALARRRSARTATLSFLSRHPRVLESLVGAVVG